MRSPRNSAPPPPIMGNQKGKMDFSAPPKLGAGGLLCVLLLMASATVHAAPPNAPAPAPTVTAPGAIPDYGGRDSAPLATGDAAPNPAAQAGRALEALVLVLAGVGGSCVSAQTLRAGAAERGRQAGADQFLRPEPPDAHRHAGGARGDSRIVPAAARRCDAACRHRAGPDPAARRRLAIRSSPSPNGPRPIRRTSRKRGLRRRLLKSIWPAPTLPSSGIAAANQRLRSLLSRPQPKDTL